MHTLCHIGGRHLQIIRVLVVFGVGAIIGDGVLTPALSVLSSIEGLHEVATISQGEMLSHTATPPSTHTYTYTNVHLQQQSHCMCALPDIYYFVLASLHSAS